MSIEMKHIDDITKLPSGIHAIHFNTAKPPITIRDPDVAEEMIMKLRAFRRTENNPEDRIVHGIDAMNVHGVFDFNAEKAAIKKTLSLRELRPWREVDEDVVNFLCALTSLADYHEAVGDGLKARYGRLVTTIRENSKVINDPQFTTGEVDCLKNILKIMDEMNGLSRRYDTAIHTMLVKWFPDYGTKGDEDEVAK